MNYARQSFLSRLRKEVLLLDGAMGTMLQQRGLKPGEPPEAFMLSKPGVIREIHRAYVDAGADILITATFGASPVRLSEDPQLAKRMREINRLAVRLAKEAAAPGTLIAAGLGPCGKLIHPLGDAGFEEVKRNYEAQVQALVSMDPDLFIIETIFELREMKAIVQAVREHYDGPVIAQLTFQEDGRTFFGTDALTALTVIESLDVDVVGANCSVGPRKLLELFEDMGRYAVKPLSVEPNAGIPQRKGETTVFPGKPEELMECVPGFVSLGVCIIGGCCGTDEKYIAQIRPVVKAMKPEPREPEHVTRLASGTRTLIFGPGQPLRIIGERINPSGRKRFKEELRQCNMTTVRREASTQVEAGAEALDINVGIGGADTSLDKKPMIHAVPTVLEVAPTPPLVIDSPDPLAIEAGLSEAPGKCLINSVTGEKERIDAIFPLARKWGAAVLGLLVDEKGVPTTVDERLRVAEKIVAACDQAGLPRRDLFIDCVCMPVSSSPEQARTTLKTIEEIKRRFNVCTILGLSNISFGLPRRDIINRTFLSMAMEAGLDGVIANPLDEGLKEVIAAGNLLLERDRNFEIYISTFGGRLKREKVMPKTEDSGETEDPGIRIRRAVIDGDRDNIENLVREALRSGKDPMEINSNHLIPAMEEVGKRFNAKVFFLPQVILAAETMQKAFRIIKPLLPKEKKEKKGKVILATVKGDVHDIGKNMVGAVLENHGYTVLDLGKNVKKETIIEKAMEEKADIIALSALMTTTMVEMGNVIRYAREKNLDVKFLVGGAVVTKDFADEIGAHAFGKDAMEALEQADRLFNEK